ncbi:MAG: TIGR03435 family protein [Bryobacterales bacterium]|nr:TIGR03435 family protein [Bryobacterales bacterium]MBV9401813.1 TIGR03435 family protein [Bryobacterales bacterium]
MKNRLLWIATLTAMALTALQAQNLTGAWQGALQAPDGRQLRTVVKIALDNDKLKATLYSIDQGGTPIPASTITRDGSSIKMTIAAMNGTYEGKLSGDGNSITGTWTQGGPVVPLNLTRATPETAKAIPEPPAPPVRMAANANPEFEVATIKPSDPNRPGKLFTVRGQEVITINTTMSDIMTMAYDLHARQIAGAPSWFESDKFDIAGKPDAPGQPNVAQMKIMLQKLLADRLQLKYHREKPELNVYALTMGKTGAKFSKSERDPNSLPGLFFQGPGTN